MMNVSLFMTEERAMRCILCGDHEPAAAICNQNPDGIDREAKRMGRMKWCRVSGLVAQKAMPAEMREQLRTFQERRRAALGQGTTNG